MEKKIVAKKVIQGVAIGYGVVGIIFFWGGIFFSLAMFLSKEESVRFVTILVLLIPGLMIGSLFLLAAYQNIRKFGENSIRSLSTVIAFTALGLFLLWFGPSLGDFTTETISKPYYIIFFFIPLIVAFLIYSILTKLLIRITQNQRISTNQSATGDDRKTGTPEL